MYSNRQSNAGKCYLKCHTSNSTIVNQDCCHVRKKGTRLWHSLFYSDNKQTLQTCCQFCHHQHPNCEPSRISVKQLWQKLKLILKSQLLFKKCIIVKNNNSHWHRLKGSVPRSSQLHSIVRIWYQLSVMSTSKSKCSAKQLNNSATSTPMKPIAKQAKMQDANDQSYEEQDACSGVHTSLKNEDMRAMSLM